MTYQRRTTSGLAATTGGVIAIALGIALVAPDARSQGKPNPMTPGLPPAPQLNACTQLLQAGGVKVDVTATATGPTTVELTWQGPPGDYEVKSSTGGFQAAVSLAQPRVVPKRGEAPALAQGAATHASAQPDAVNSYALTATLKDGRKACGAGSVKTPPMPVVAIQPKGPLTPKQFSLSGWVDLHTHPMSNLAFAGRLFHGAPDTNALLPGGVATPDGNACGAHHARAGNIAEALGGDACTLPQLPGSPHNLRGFPDFAQWPAWTDSTHQKMWVDWIRRAVKDGGLRVMVALAHNNGTLAKLVAGGGDGPLDDQTAGDLQVDEIKSFVGRHGPGTSDDFMEVALQASDIARIVRSGRLAIVLGVELDQLGNGAFFAPPPPKPPQTPPLTTPVTSVSMSLVDAEINRLYAKGVRYVFPIHLTDNVFGGTAVYEGIFDLANYFQVGSYWDLKCSSCTDAIGYHYSQGMLGLDPGIVNVLTGAIGAAKLGGDPFRHPGPPPQCSPVVPQVCPVANSPVGHRNKKGLTDLGKFAIKAMMKRGMLIDVDHMSQTAVDDAFALADVAPLKYPLVSGHNGLRNGALEGRDSENNRTTAQLQKIAGLGGMFGIGTDGVDAWTWAKDYRTATRAMGNVPGIVAFGTDMNSLVKSARPPTIWINKSPAPPLPMPRSSAIYDATFTRSTTGTKTWDYNKDGVAHYGMMADLVRDIRTAPASETGDVTGVELVDNELNRSADYFWHMWERCEGQKINVK